jgi:hypothetical protein
LPPRFMEPEEEKRACELLNRSCMSRQPAENNNLQKSVI